MQECAGRKACGEKEIRGAAFESKRRDPALWRNLRGKAAPLTRSEYRKRYSAGLVMTAQAMRGGAALLASAATA
jgi:hypothetical protein